MPALNPQQWLSLKRIVRFGDTDAAGVMHFYQLLRWCHEAWEESLERYGLPASDVFPNCSQNQEDPKVALPIVHCHADFRRPIKTGDHLVVELFPERIDSSSFQVQSKFQMQGDEVAIGLLRHLAIDAKTSSRCALPTSIDLWLEASSLKLGVKPI